MSKRNLIVALKSAVSIALIIYLLDRIDLRAVGARLGGADPVLLAPALLLFASQLLLVGSRYDLVGRAVDAALPTRAALRLVMIGQFFSQTLPSSFGGDAVRAFLATRLGLGWGRAISAVLCDRAIALVVLLALATATIPLFLALVEDATARRAAMLPGAVLACGLAILFVAREDRIATMSRWRPVAAVTTLIGDFRRVVFISKQAPEILTISLIVHLAGIVATWILARALAIDLPFVSCLLLLPPVLIATVIPISIAGWGVRENAMVIGFGLVGVTATDALALSVAFGLAQIVIGLPGGVLWLASGRPRFAAPADDQKSTQRPSRSQSP